MTSPKSFALAPLALALAMPALADDNSTETLVVTASRAPQQISDIAATVWVISGDDLRAKIDTGSDLKDALARLIPSLDAGSQSRTNYAQNMRGRGVLVMIDGVSLNSTRGISRQFESIDPFNIARIEVLSGATAIYGGGATGGIINIITKSADSQELALESQVSVQSGFETSDDYQWKLAQSISGGTDSLKGRLAVAYEKIGGLYNADGDLVLPDITQNSSQFSDALDLMGKLEWQLAEHQQLSFTGQYYDNEQDSDYGVYLGPNLAGLSDPSVIEPRKGLSLDKQPQTRRHQFNLTYNNSDLLGQQLMVQLYDRSEAIRFFPFPSTYRPFGQTLPMIGASQQDTDIQGAKLVMLSDWQNLRLTYGVDAEKESFTANQRIYSASAALASGGLDYQLERTLKRYPDIDNRSLAAFAQAQWALTDNLKLNGGLRFQNIENKVGSIVPILQQYLGDLGVYQQLGMQAQADAVPGGKADYDVWTGNLGLVYQLAAGQQLWANYSEGFDLPDPAKYYGNGVYDQSGSGPVLLQGVSVADNKLKGIKTDSMELGWRLSDGGLDLQVAAYYSQSDKTISYDRTNLAVKVNDDKTRIYGLEAKADYQFDQGYYSGASFHVLKSETKAGSDWQKLTASTASPNSATLYGGWRGDKTWVDLNWQFLANYNAQGQHLEGYDVLNLGVGYQLPAGELRFGVQNLLNEDYETLWSQRAQILYANLSNPALFSYEGRGRTYALSYSLNW
ncbi:TonB-dependent receptor [Gallaecimonas xiamenensis]|uniref:Ferric aerobactin receptor n=1 Tax=Gallaecimonas xiamenensis 3-C-1 TaxID=745411 RepID=K2K3C2_9GAMM|nr:TonB-dependent receptor [Gallaecimonas xiamenensis]EKE77434.1 putative TonB-dependent receptor [Gallaecimonas xiamenensis 3-C-1]